MKKRPPLPRRHYETIFFLFMIATLLAMLGCATAPMRDCTDAEGGTFLEETYHENAEPNSDLYDFYREDFETVNSCSLGEDT